MKKVSIFILLQLITSLNFIYAQSWNFVDTGIEYSDSSYILSSLHTDEKILLGLGRIIGWTYYIPGGLMISEDNGNNWAYKDLINPSFGNESLPISTLLLVDSILFAGSPGGGIYITSDWGDSWIDANNGINGNAYGVKILELLNQNVFAGTQNGVYISTNLGQSWEERNNGIPSNSVGYNEVNAIIEINDTLYAGIFDANQGEGGIYKSTDNGNSWTTFLTQIYFMGGYYNCDILTMKYFNDFLYIGVQGLGIFRSSNVGYSWEHTYIYGDYGKFTFETSGMIAVWGGIELSRNNGYYWEDIRYNLTNMNYYKFNTAEIIDKNIFVGTTRIGLWKFDLDQINSAEIKINLSDAFYLSQNYPNPFNPSTSIQYAISSRQFVTLKVYDLLGREVATLVNEEKPTGSYNAQFTINNVQLSSGIYFYKLQAGDFVETKKMLMIK